MRNFADRHLGLSPKEEKEMLLHLGLSSMDELIDLSIPSNILLKNKPEREPAMSEHDFLKHIRQMANKNEVFRNYIGQGYYGTIVPSVILRNILENPGWYTQYTPYQAEISQGRLESLLNFQTLVSDLCGLPIANASLLDEATAAAEAMCMLYAQKNKRKTTHPRFVVDQNVFPQTLRVMETRALPLGIEIEVRDLTEDAELPEDSYGVLVQYPDSSGQLVDWKEKIEEWKNKGIQVVMSTDLMALTLIKSPGELGADVAVGNSQRFGVPLGFGGPHAAFFACTEEYKRDIPGRIIGVSIDADGRPALRMALQTREQHIRREKATSNICTAQALLANMSAMYALYHGPEGLREIAKKIHTHAAQIAKAALDLGYELGHRSFFDTILLKTNQQAKIKELAEAQKINLAYTPTGVMLSMDETVSEDDVEDLISILAQAQNKSTVGAGEIGSHIPEELHRQTTYLEHEVFNSYHTETQMMRYIKALENKDLSLDSSMISLGSCTMKLNAASELIPISWPEFSDIHPHAPLSQAAGYMEIIGELQRELCQITGFDACSLQPNSGAQGEYAGLYTIKKYHENQGENQRNVVLIPISAHGTNPASAAMMGMKIVIVACDEKGNIDVEDLRKKAKEHENELAALMVTYPSTHGVFEKSIKEICDVVHAHGGQVYMDGANMNAQVYYTSPAEIGADVCHLNLHKTFAIPHGGGGPGMGPICCRAHLADFLPSDPMNSTDQDDYSVSASVYGSALILIISYAYIKMLGTTGLRRATATSILNANYMRSRLGTEYDILYTGEKGFCAHEFILDLRPFKEVKIEAEDVAKRLMDYGFHAPTLSFPVPGTFMIEPTESEDRAELDRFCDAMLSIRKEIEEVVKGKIEKTASVLHHAPHTAETLTADKWDRGYSRSRACFPLPYVRQRKFWPSISRINNTHGDRNLICSCPPTQDYAVENQIS